MPLLSGFLACIPISGILCPYFLMNGPERGYFHATGKNRYINFLYFSKMDGYRRNNAILCLYFFLNLLMRGTAILQGTCRAEACRHVLLFAVRCPFASHYNTKAPTIPAAIPITTTDANTNSSALRGNERDTISMDGRLTAGSVSSRAAAGPAPRPSAVND